MVNTPVMPAELTNIEKLLFAVLNFTTYVGIFGEHLRFVVTTARVFCCLEAVLERMAEHERKQQESGALRGMMEGTRPFRQPRKPLVGPYQAYVLFHIYVNIDTRTRSRISATSTMASSIQTRLFLGNRTHHLVSQNPFFHAFPFPC